jgi:hypothetical protein
LNVNVQHTVLRQRHALQMRIQRLVLRQIGQLRNDVSMGRDIISHSTPHAIGGLSVTGFAGLGKVGQPFSEDVATRPLLRGMLQQRLTASHAVARLQERVGCCTRLQRKAGLLQPGVTRICNRFLQRTPLGAS